MLTKRLAGSEKGERKEGDIAGILETVQSPDEISFCYHGDKVTGVTSMLSCDFRGQDKSLKVI